MKESGVGYGSINHPVDRDPVCGYTGIIDNECPSCHRTEDDGDERFERISRGTIINTDYIQKVDLKETSITLKSGQKTYASANELRKGALSSVRNS